MGKFKEESSWLKLISVKTENLKQLEIHRPRC